MSSVPLAVFIIISAFTINLMLQCALGIKEIVDFKKNSYTTTAIKLSVMFFSVVVLWLFFTKIIFLLTHGIFIYIIMFPVSYMVYDVLEYLVFDVFLKKNSNGECFFSFPGGITAAAVFICVNIADNFMQALVLSFGFAAGILLVIFIIAEILKRASLEAVPRFLDGKPLMLLTMSLLSLVFSTASLIILRMINIR